MGLEPNFIKPSFNPDIGLEPNSIKPSFNPDIGLEPNSIKPSFNPDIGLEPNFIKPSFNPDSPVITPLPHSFLLSSASSINHTNPKNPVLQNIEMVPLQPLTYTSLRDLLPASPPGSILWPTYNDRKDSWREIPIKDPLLQHAAWAYLRPMTAVRGDEDRGLLGKLADGCGGFFGCFGGFLDQVMWRSMNPALVSEDVEDGDDDFS